MATEPLTETVFLILLSLARTPQHGYAILKDVEELSGGRVKFSTGTLYGALARLLDMGWIRMVEESGNRGRRDYALTDSGRAALDSEMGRMRGLLASAGRWITEGGA